MKAFDGSWHPGNGCCVQVQKKVGKGKASSWHAVTTKAKRYLHVECSYLAGVLNMRNGSTARVLNPDGTICEET